MHPELVMLAMVAAVAFIAYLLISSRHKERIALLEFDRDISVFKGSPNLRVGGALKIGLFFLFGGAGLLMGYFLHRLFRIPEEVAIFSLLFISAGAGLIAYYMIARRVNREEEG